MTIHSRPSSPEYRQNFDLIFGPKRKPKEAGSDEELRRGSYAYWAQGTESLDSHPQAD